MTHNTLKVILSCRLLFLSAIPIVLAGTPLPGSAAGFSLKPSKHCFAPIIEIRGKIDQGDTAGLVAVVEKATSEIRGRIGRDISCLVKKDIRFTFVLNSSGGDLGEAMRMGRYIRGLYGAATHAQNCASACVLLHVAGMARTAMVWKNNKGIGIHRFYFADLKHTNISEIRNSRDAIRQALQAYAREMDISPRLFELAESVSPDSIRWLTQSET